MLHKFSSIIIWISQFDNLIYSKKPVSDYVDYQKSSKLFDIFIWTF